MTDLSFQFAIAQAAFPGFSLDQAGDSHVVEPFDDGNQLDELGADLSTAWHHPDTDIRLRKRILRTVLTPYG